MTRFDRSASKEYRRVNEENGCSDDGRKVVRDEGEKIIRKKVHEEGSKGEGEKSL